MSLSNPTNAAAPDLPFGDAPQSFELSLCKGRPNVAGAVQYWWALRRPDDEKHEIVFEAAKIRFAVSTRTTVDRRGGRLLARGVVTIRDATPVKAASSPTRPRTIPKLAVVVQSAHNQSPPESAMICASCGEPVDRIVGFQPRQ